MGAYLDTFEVTARAGEWPREQWCVYLRSPLSGQDLSAVASLPAADQADYSMVKQTLLSTYHISTDTYRKKAFDRPFDTNNPDTWFPIYQQSTNPSIPTTQTLGFLYTSSRPTLRYQQPRHLVSYIPAVDQPFDTNNPDTWFPIYQQSTNPSIPTTQTLGFLYTSSRPTLRYQQPRHLVSYILTVDQPFDTNNPDTLFPIYQQSTNPSIPTTQTLGFLYTSSRPTLRFQQPRHLVSYIPAVDQPFDTNNPDTRFPIYLQSTNPSIPTTQTLGFLYTSSRPTLRYPQPRHLVSYIPAVDQPFDTHNPDTRFPIYQQSTSPLIPTTQTLGFLYTSSRPTLRYQQPRYLVSYIPAVDQPFDTHNPDTWFPIYQQSTNPSIPTTQTLGFLYTSSRPTLRYQQPRHLVSYIPAVDQPFDTNNPDTWFPIYQQSTNPSIPTTQTLGFLYTSSRPTLRYQ